MKITIEASSDEVAALVKKLQEPKKNFVPHDAEGVKDGGPKQKCECGYIATHSERNTPDCCQ